MKKYLVILLLMIILILGLKFFNKSNNYYLNVSNEAVSFFKKSSYDRKLVKPKDRKALEDYLSTLTHNNQVVDLSNYILKASSYYTEDSNTKGVYIQDGKCFIKYKDLDIPDHRDEINYNGEPYQKVVCNNYYTYMYLSYFYPSYEDTQKNPKYDYVFSAKEEISNGYLFTYKSTYDGTLFKLKFIIDNNTIKSITAEE